MTRSWRFPVGAVAAMAVVLAGGCGLQTGGVGAPDGDGGLPELADGDTPTPVDGRDDAPTADDADAAESAAVCGNGLVEAPEECDDGNPDDSDACPTSCRHATCGDGFLHAGFEQCDEGPDNDDGRPDACRTDCTDHRCGDGVVDTGEACDDGNLVEGDECLNDCRVPGCGNGIVNPGEACDDGDLDNTDDCLNTCVEASCGDGYLWAGVEECDGVDTTCDTPCGSTGRRACVACAFAASCTPPAETCNGGDDDCDGTPDNGFACRAGAPAPCATWCGSVGTGTCSAGCLPAVPAACGVPAESCNGLDDNCDGFTDEGFPLFCDIPHGHAPADLCADPGESLCNGVDDNCNGTTDEGFDCIPGLSRSCTTACGVPGSQSCSGSCSWGGCCSATEICQPVGTTACDDNCNGTVDEGCGVVAPPNDTCAFATPITPGTIRGDTTPAAHHDTPSCASDAGRDLWYSFTLPARRIVYLDTVDGGAWSTVLEVRSGSCTGPVVTGGCNDDACGGDRSQLVLELAAGTYYLLVDGHDDSHHGVFDLLFQTASCMVPRIATNGDRDGNTTGHGNSLGSSTCGGNASDEDAYYFALCGPTTVTSHTCSSATRFDTVLYYRTGDCWNGYPEPICNNDSTCSTTAVGASRVSTALPKGLSFVVIDGRGTAPGVAGPYRLNVSGLP